MGPSRARSYLVTLFALLAAVGQLAVTLAPIAEGLAGRSAPAHVESEGVRKHFAHSDATCQACAAASLRSLPFAVRADPPRIERAAPVPRGTDAHVLPPRDRAALSPRAPPSLG